MTALTPALIVLGILAALIVSTALMCAAATIAALWVKQVLMDASSRYQYQQDRQQMDRKPRSRGPACEQSPLTPGEKQAWAVFLGCWARVIPAPGPPREAKRP